MKFDVMMRYIPQEEIERILAEVVARDLALHGAMLNRLKLQLVAGPNGFCEASVIFSTEAAA